tara:strand:- start:87 stop:602 length:516 start_codon:yes stop_codon:yes gene_type:complete
MKRFFMLAFSMFALINLNACMTTQEAAAKYDAQSEKELCINYYKFPDYNIWQADRRASIIRRGIDCSPYMAEGLRKARALNALESGLTILANQEANTSTGTSLSTGFTKVCYYDGVGGPSALTVSSVSICPLTYSHNISGFTKVCHYPKAMGGPKALTVPSTSICPINYPR